ncbi:MAG: WD40 repeat domain-containing protein, partial [Spirochaetota bacterium]
MNKLLCMCAAVLISGYSVSFAEETPRLESNTGHSVDYWSYSADGRLLVTGSNNGEICVYDADSMRFLRNFPAKNMYNGALLPDGTGICFNDSQGIRTVNLRDGTSTVFPSPGFAGIFSGFAISHDGKKIAAADDHRIMIFSYPDGKLLSETKKDNHPVRIARFSPDGSQLALVSGKNSETLLLYSLKDSTLTKLGGLFSGHGNIIDDLCFSEDGRFLASCGMDCRAIVWDLSSMSQKAVFKLEKEDYVNAVYLRNAETPLLFISFNGMLCKGDISSGKIVSKTKIT